MSHHQEEQGQPDTNLEHANNPAEERLEKELEYANKYVRQYRAQYEKLREDIEALANDSEEYGSRIEAYHLRAILQDNE